VVSSAMPKKRSHQEVAAADEAEEVEPAEKDVLMGRGKRVSEW